MRAGRPGCERAHWALVSLVQQRLGDPPGVPTGLGGGEAVQHLVPQHGWEVGGGAGVEAESTTSKLLMCVC